jgi:Leucine-rich repeat (LRR) protein
MAFPNNNMREINLSGNNITLAGFTKVLKIIMRLFPCVRVLNMSQNQLIYEEDDENHATALSSSSVKLERELSELRANKFKNFQLEDLNLDSNKPLHPLFLGIIDFSRITTLSLSGCKLEHSSSSMSSNNDTTKNTIFGSGTSTALQVLLGQKSFAALSRLCLSQNNLSKEVALLVATIARMTRLCELDLSVCGLNISGIILRF